MIAATNGTTTHNTTATSDLTSVWNRTATLGAGTGTFLGKSTDGTYWLLTASHVSTSANSTGTFATADNTSIKFSFSGTTQAIYNSDGTTADLKLVAISATDAASATYLDSLGNISVYTGTLSTGSSYYMPQGSPGAGTGTELYAVGTGRSLSIGSSYSTGTREKQWANFYPDMTEMSVSTTSTTTTTCFLEIFSKGGICMQAGEQDSGSGVFVKNGESWEIAGVAIAVGGTVSSATTVGFYEDASSDSPKTCVTYFADLSVYADQINDVMTATLIPEPSAFGFAVGALALALAATRRKRRR